MSQEGNLLDNLKILMVPIHKEGHRFIAMFAIAAIVLGAFSDFLFFVGLVLTAWCVYFFRDPERVTPQREGLVISPADGVLLEVVEAVPPAELGMPQVPLKRLSIFMNVFNVHVNRAPVAGTVTATHYFPGKFLNAALDKASEENERQALKITTTEGHDFAVVQIAGLVARRIITQVQQGDVLAVGQRFGIIRFGSRVDVYLPQGVEPLVIAGQTIVAGETVLADLHSSEAARLGVKG